jgi:hypothetical protein
MLIAFDWEEYYRFFSKKIILLMTMQAFCSSQRCSYSLVTSFSCLHWVPNQPAAVHFFNRILKKGNRSFRSYYFYFIVKPTTMDNGPSIANTKEQPDK